MNLVKASVLAVAEEDIMVCFYLRGVNKILFMVLMILSMMVVFMILVIFTLIMIRFLGVFFIPQQVKIHIVSLHEDVMIKHARIVHLHLVIG